MSLIRKENGFTGAPAFFNDLFTRDLWNRDFSHHSMTNTSIPAVNIRETAEHFEVAMAAPGMKKEDFRVELDGNLLTITSERKEQNEQREGERFTLREFSYQSFQRSFQLPKNVVDADKIEARYENGVLQLLIPKKEEAKQRPPKMIQIA